MENEIRYTAITIKKGATYLRFLRGWKFVFFGRVLQFSFTVQSRPKGRAQSAMVQFFVRNSSPSIAPPPVRNSFFISQFNVQLFKCSMFYCSLSFLLRVRCLTRLIRGAYFLHALCVKIFFLLTRLPK